MYSQITFKDGKPEQNNFDNYRLIRHNEAPKEIEVHFVENDIKPTVLGNHHSLRLWVLWLMHYIGLQVNATIINHLLLIKKY